MEIEVLKMREMLFRGKRTDNGEWVYGYYAVEMSKHYISFEEEDEFVQTGNWLEQVEVIPETVGQYTGLTDKNGTKIFERDIANLKRFDDTCSGKIVFNEKTAGFEFWWDITVGVYGEKATRKANLSVCDEIEIIGNIHDNPELLKGGANDE